MRHTKIERVREINRDDAKAEGFFPGMNGLSCFFDPKSVALVGASHSELKLGGVVLKNLLKLKRRIKIFPVNPKYPSLMGIRSYSSVEEINGGIDLAIIIRPADEVPSIIEQLAGKKSKNTKTFCALVVSAGFAEAGRSELQSTLQKTARDCGIRLMGPNCMGVYNAVNGLDTFILPSERLPRPRAGGVAVITQSGAVLSLLFESMVKADIGVSITVHYGNAADVDESDILEFLEKDSETHAVVSYLESVKDGRRFIKKARSLSRKKPLIILKGGKAAAGQAAAFSHTGRLAGAYEVFHSILKQYGIPEASDFEDLVDSALALSTDSEYRKRTKKKYSQTTKIKTKNSEGNRILVLTNGGGAGVLASDECVKQGFSQPELPSSSLASLKKVFPAFYGFGNPLDITAQGGDRDYRVALNELGESYDGFVVIALSAVTGITPALAKILADFRKRTGKPVAFHTGQDETGRNIAGEARKSGIPSFPTPERAVRALVHLLS
ncbi:MAG: CoA-binding protein [Nitrospiraceae bacterium]|nr:CoA-binding protein [Nitrospiraceae bacterium]